jgi:hypothetical protein
MTKKREGRGAGGGETARIVPSTFSRRREVQRKLIENVVR